MDAEFLDKKIEKDFYNDLPGFVCESLDRIIRKYGDQPWFLKAWNEYRSHVLESNMDDMKMPGFVFKKYIDNKIEHSDLFANEEYTIGDLMHYGTKRHSGRYPWGSGEDPFQHAPDFYNRVRKYEKQGLNEQEICELEGVNSKELRIVKSIGKDRIRSDKIAYAKSAKADGKSNVQIAKELSAKYNEDIGDTTVISLLNADREARMNIASKTADSLKKIINETPSGMLDMGTGIERELNISKEKLDAALYILQASGYNVYTVRVPQATQKGQGTILRVLAKPDVEKPKQADFDKIGHITDYTSDDGATLRPAFVYPKSMDSKRLMIRYAEDGGLAKDGVVEIRRGVKDLSLGETDYAQVRILVDNDHYIKGMAVYSDGSDMPDGVDVIFNTNKDKSISKLDVLKSTKDNLKKDPNNPFGSAIKEGIGPKGGQSYYLDENGKPQLSLINKRADEGDWYKWSKELPSQFLAKQPVSLIKRQLALAEVGKESEYEQINKISNPLLKQQTLNEFADKCDKAAVDLKAANLPNQKYQVILPLSTIKDNEIYAPNYEDGSEVILVRFPHGGTYEIPRLKVNNRNEEGNKVITPSALDAVGISHNTAAVLSGADFDGDTVMVIPVNGKFRVSTKDPLPGLKGFDPTMSYGPDSHTTDKDGVEHYYRNGIEYKHITKQEMQKQMGVISNLITDMTIKGGATDDEYARAVRHSMVVIDSYKHHLDYKKSEEDNGIKNLQDKYQLQVDPKTGRTHHGASTLISKSKSEVRIPKRTEGDYFSVKTGERLKPLDEEKGLYINPETGEIFSGKEKRVYYADPKTGEKVYRETGDMIRTIKYKDSNGKTKNAKVFQKDNKFYYKDSEGSIKQVTNEEIKETPVLVKSTKMAEAKDARTLSSGTIQEELYADYANKMKSLANRARKEAISTEDYEYSPAANKTYAKEIEELDQKLDESLRNAPKERQAQMITAAQMESVREENPGLTDEEESKIKTRLLMAARVRVGAKRTEIYISDDQWKAIQSGAVSKNKLTLIFKAADKSRLKELSMPLPTNKLSRGEVSRIKSMSKLGYTNEEIADQLGISSSTVVGYLSGEKEAK